MIKIPDLKGGSADRIGRMSAQGCARKRNTPACDVHGCTNVAVNRDVERRRLNRKSVSGRQVRSPAIHLSFSLRGAFFCNNYSLMIKIPDLKGGSADRIGRMSAQGCARKRNTPACDVHGCTNVAVNRDVERRRLNRKSVSGRQVRVPGNTFKLLFKRSFFLQ